VPLLTRRRAPVGRPLAVASILAAVAALAAAPVSAHHQATVSATATSLTLDPSKCAFSERRTRSRCDGTRRARVTWSVSCGTNKPYVTVDFLARRAGGGKPILLASETADLQTTGVTSTLLEPGARVYATVTVDCVWDDPEGTGPEAHSVAVTSAPTAEVVVPPWLVSVDDVYNNFCNFTPRSGRVVLQAGQSSILDFGIDFNDRSLLGVNRRRPAGVRKMWVNARGAGIRKRRHPELYLLGPFGQRDPVAAALRLNPRRAGSMRVWAEVGGVRTNALSVPVVRSRC
jgi:hypothetical protein